MRTAAHTAGSSTSRREARASSSTWLRRGSPRVTGSRWSCTSIAWDELLAAIAAGAASPVLLVDADRARRHGLAAELRNAGSHVDESATPLEALAALGAGGARPWLVAIADSEPAVIADELRAYVADAHPHLRNFTLRGRS